MRRPNVTNIDNRTIFPGTIEVTEKRAPTDESVRLLNEMQDKAASNIICKVSNEKNNAFQWEAYFMNIVSVDFRPAGILVLKLKVNGHKYEKKVKVNCDLFSRVSPGDFKYFDVDSEVRNFLYVQLSFIIGSILLEDSQKFEDIMNKMLMAGAHDFDYKTLADI